MDWIDTGIVLHVRPLGETNAVTELFTREHGRHPGLVRGGRSRRIRPLLQTGNLVKAEWRARLQDHLGYFTLELDTPYASRALDDRLALSGLGVMAEMLRLLAERDPHPALFDMAILVLEHIDDVTVWSQLLVRWELRLLTELGFGLDLDRCVVTGTRDDLIHVSPKSGRAVSAGAGEPYKDRLLPLPAFLRTANGLAGSREEIADGFVLTGHFLERDVFHQRNAPLPPARQELLRLLAHASG